jgi:tRNA uridine 5-carboxymethylaminomethyl modification enzyme
MKISYDVIVIGAGHAGNEAACAAANLGSKTVLITMDMNKIGQMSCNPAVGGIAKGQIVREIDALGGQMGIVTDKTAIQFRLLNESKGPAMWSPRAQSDREKFIQEWKRTMDRTPNLDIWQDTVSQILVKNGEITGVVTKMNVEFEGKCVILTAGTFLNGLMHIGKVQIPGGRVAEPSSDWLTEQLKEMGFVTDRMKTGTPVRVDGRTVDFSQLEEQTGNDDFHKFSYLDFEPRKLKQLSCWIAYTSPTTHKILEEGLKDSPLYNGQIQSIGPRYCPSNETKIFTFSERERHQLFLEPEGEDTQEYYLNGFSSSLPLEVQYKALRSVKGFENAKIYRPGYAIEYDFFDPTQLQHTLETKLIKNLFFAGQVNGTTGYEEAGGQGLVAVINAHMNCKGEKPFTLSRDEAYIGVLIDDLVTKGVDEPYRMFTSRAEYRILLRQDDADMRLTEKGYKLGLATKERLELLQEKREWRDKLIKFIREEPVRMLDANPMLIKIGSSPLKVGTKLFSLLSRPEISINQLAENFPNLKEEIDKIPNRKEEIVEAVEILLKYEGYIDREKGIADKLKRLESIKIKGRIDYDTVHSLSTEAKQKLKKINPETIGQASRISGIAPSDINILLVLLGR